MLNRIWNTRTHQNRIDPSFALVIEEGSDFRDSVVALLRKHGWLVHGMSRAEEAFSILAHIPYGLIVLDSELPGMSGIDFVRILHNSREWRTIGVIVITSSDSPSWQRQLVKCGALLARRSSWKDDLFLFLGVERGIRG